MFLLSVTPLERHPTLEESRSVTFGRWLYPFTKHLIPCLHNTGGIRIASLKGARPSARVSQAFIRVYKGNTRLLCFTTWE